MTVKDELLNYKELYEEKDFEYFFRFKRTENNFTELWRMKSAARESLKEWLLSMHVNPLISEAVSNASSELIENCIKYSVLDAYSFVLINVFERNIFIETVNKAGQEQISGIKEILNYITGSNKTINDVYIERIRQSCMVGKSQLGLVKIILETKGNIMIIDEKDNDIIHLRIKIEV